MLEKRYIPHEILPRFHFGNSNRCTYCGQTPSDREHVVPRSMQSLKEHPGFIETGPWTWACRSCNLTLGNRFFPTFKERCQYVQDQISRRVKPVIWHNWELKQFDYGLKKFIAADRARRMSNAERADWFGSRSFLSNIENLQWAMPSPNESRPNRFIQEFFASILRDIKRIYRTDP